MPILLEKNFNFIKLKKENGSLVKKYYETVDSVIQYCIDEKKENMLNLLINNISKIRKLYKLKDEDIDVKELKLLKSFNNNSS